jgi:3',5'-cyclic AMP phosphodiesterase CpdA
MRTALRTTFPLLALLLSVTAARAAPAPSIAMSGSLGSRTLLGAPGDTSIVLSTAFDAAATYFYRYGTGPDDLALRTPERTTAGGKAEAETLSGLAPATTYWYRLVTARPDGATWVESEPGRFATRKPPGVAFTCVVEADPHLDENSSAEVYRTMLGLMARDRPDFAIDLGDSSMAEKLASSAAEYEARNRLLRSFWDDIGGSVPFFMALGNHDGEHGWKPAGGKPTADVAAAIRRAWFPNPVPAPASPYSGVGDTAYAFTWGDALFVVLDPFTYTTRTSSTDNWCWTLGREQYDWLAGLLAAATARYRFVFIHHLVGGGGKDARGGADIAGLFEWGGRNPDGTDEFAAHRPGWAMPIHDLLVRGKVDVVFHGHDHFYAREEKDGIVYLCVPQPSAAREVDPARSAAEYGYTKGTFLSSPGYLRLAVSPERASVELVRGTGGVVADTVIIAP